MLKTHGTLRLKNTPQRRRRFIRSMFLQTILQCLTFAGAIVTYHYTALPQLTDEARKEGQSIGWQNAIRTTCPNPVYRLGG